ncbi:MAG TPA: DUF488 domain-containing protein [Usitatibacter sp.]|nr:DUF488 domain-containing protein [Usitatibacter sp.]
MVGATRRPVLTAIKTKRAYEAPARGDGTRVLVDRLWPRGLAKEAAAVDRWMHELAPSTALRKWFGHDPARWDEFRRRYAAELADRKAELGTLRALARSGTVTLLYGARDERHNNAVALRDILLSGSVANPPD